MARSIDGQYIPWSDCELATKSDLQETDRVRDEEALMR